MHIHNRYKLLTTCICLSLVSSVPILAAEEAADLDMDTIVVTGKRYEEEKPVPKPVAAPEALPVRTQIQQKQSNMHIVTAKEIEANHYNDVQEALQNVNGVQINDMSTASGVGAFIRLNGSDRVQVLVDGKPMANPQNNLYGRGSTDLSTLPPMAAVERIEVTKGSGSVKYGSGSVGGTINIVTKKDQAPGVKTTLDAHLGSWGTHGFGLTNQGKSDKTSWFVNADFSQQAYMKYNDGYETDKARADNNQYSLTASINQRLNDDKSITVDAFHKRLDFSYDKFDHPSPGNNHHKFIQSGDKSRAEKLYNNYSVAYNFDESTDMPGFIRYYDNYTKTTYNDYFYHVESRGVQMEKGWHVDNHRITAGLEWNEDNGSNYSQEYGRIYADKKRHTQSAYVEDAIELGKWTLTPGVRYDHNSAYGENTTPRIAFNYQANDQFNFYGNWGRVFNPPTLNDLYYNVRTYHGNPDLRPETGYTQTLGFTYKADPKTTFDVSVFQNSLSDALYRDMSNRYDRRVENIDKEKKRGFEVSMDKIINDDWDYSLGYSYIHTRINKGDGKGFVRDTTYNSNNRPNGYHAALNYHHQAWTANLTMNAGSGRDDYYTTDSYITWDVAATYQASKNTQIYAKVNNLTNKGYDMYYGWPEPGRYYQLGVKYTF